MSCCGCGKARSLKELHLYYLAARNVQDPAEKAARALELCHSLIIELSNHVYCMHGQSTHDAAQSSYSRTSAPSG